MTHQMASDRGLRTDLLCEEWGTGSCDLKYCALYISAVDKKVTIDCNKCLSVYIL